MGKLVLPSLLAVEEALPPRVVIRLLGIIGAIIVISVIIAPSTIPTRPVIIIAPSIPPASTVVGLAMLTILPVAVLVLIIMSKSRWSS